MKKYTIVMMIVALLWGCSSPNKYDELSSTLANTNATKAYNIGIAFGGGGVRGFMHLGVIKALEEEGLKANLVSGSSAGSIAAILYASGMTYAEIETIVYDLEAGDVLDFVLSSQGAINGKKLSDWINRHVNYDDLSSLPIPLAITATNLTNKEIFVIHSGNPGHAVQASSSIPGAVIAIDYQGDVLVDGGLLSVVPVYPLREMGANKVIAVDIYCHNQKFLTPDASAGEVVIATIRMQSCRLSEEEMNSADLVINMDYEPSSFADFDSKSEAIEAGYQITKKMMPSIKALIEL